MLILSLLCDVHVWSSVYLSSARESCNAKLMQHNFQEPEYFVNELVVSLFVHLFWLIVCLIVSFAIEVPGLTQLVLGFQGTLEKMHFLKIPSCDHKGNAVKQLWVEKFPVARQADALRASGASSPRWRGGFGGSTCGDVWKNQHQTAKAVMKWWGQGQP